MPEKSLILTDWQARAKNITQISVPVEPQPTRDIGPNWMWDVPESDISIIWDRKGPPPRSMALWCPYRVGTVLVGKETWCLPDPTDRRTICYRASDDPVTTGARWRSPAPMPKWAARHRWKVTAVSVRRLIQTTIDDVRAEGLEASRSYYRELWQSRYGDRYPWESNPWVWVLKLKTETV